MSEARRSVRSRSLRACAVLGLAWTTLLVPVEAQAQQHDEHTQHGASGQASPYAEYDEREIKALSQEQIDGLLAGEGMGLALPAELHGYPGPRHVLDLADELNLSTSQLEATEELFASMNRRARELGRAIVELERDLDAAFAAGSVTPDELDRLVREIGLRRAELRAVHLGAHLELWPVLAEAQRDAYARLRGYHD